MPKNGQVIWWTNDQVKWQTNGQVNWTYNCDNNTEKKQEMHGLIFKINFANFKLQLNIPYLENLMYSWLETTNFTFSYKSFLSNSIPAVYSGIHNEIAHFQIIYYAFIKSQTRLHPSSE